LKEPRNAIHNETINHSRPRAGAGAQDAKDLRKTANRLEDSASGMEGDVIGPPEGEEGYTETLKNRLGSKKENPARKVAKDTYFFLT